MRRSSVRIRSGPRISKRSPRRRFFVRYNIIKEAVFYEIDKSYYLLYNYTMSEKKKTIVLVEDEKTLANLIELRLGRAGYKVETAYDGQKGLDLILKSNPDLVLLDIMLPGLSGFDILNKLKEEHLLPNLPIIIISNSGQSLELQRAVDLGARDYLIKVNFTPDEVLEKVEKVLQGKTEIKSTNKHCILLVEDEKILADSIERKFIQKHHRIFKAVNASEARKALGDEKIDLILLDIILPDINGFQFLEELKKDKKTKDIPVIIISNLGEKEEIARGKKEGAVDYIVKSDTVPGEIVEKVEKILKHK